MSAEITAEQASQITMAADDCYERIKWMVISSMTLRDELRRLSLDCFLAGLRQGDVCKGEK